MSRTPKLSHLMKAQLLALYHRDRTGTTRPGALLTKKGRDVANSLTTAAGRGVSHRALVRRGLCNTVCADCYNAASAAEDGTGAEMLARVGLPREVLVERVGEAEADRVTRSLDVQGLSALAELAAVDEGRSCAACGQPAHW